MGPAREYRCIFTGRPGEHCHHPTCRAAAGRYLDPSFVVPIIGRQHAREHQSLIYSGLDDVTDPSKARLLRTGTCSSVLASIMATTSSHFLR